MRRVALIGLCTLAVAFDAACAGDTPLKYPHTMRGKQVDDYHGKPVADPYRWLEADVRESKEVAAWVEAENKVTNAYLDAIPERDAHQEAAHRIVELRGFSLPAKKGGLYFYSRNDGLQNQSVLFVADGLKAKPRVARSRIYGPRMAPSRSRGTAVSPEAKYLAYSQIRGGFRLEHLVRPRYSHRQGSERRAQVDQVLRRFLDQRRQGLLL